MTEFVRVRLENGSEASISAEYAESLGLAPLNKPATADGRSALPAKFNPLKKKPVAPPAADPSLKEI